MKQKGKKADLRQQGQSERKRKASWTGEERERLREVRNGVRVQRGLAKGSTVSAQKLRQK